MRHIVTTLGKVLIRFSSILLRKWPGQKANADQNGFHKKLAAGDEREVVLS